tara:strand:+ start:1256 stop:1387 length:132 start_codon:yes stop_codon:yes gene_type:complete
MLSIFFKELFSPSMLARLDIFKIVNTNNIKKNIGMKKNIEKLL